MIVIDVYDPILPIFDAQVDGCPFKATHGGIRTYSAISRRIKSDVNILEIK